VAEQSVTAPCPVAVEPPRTGEVVRIWWGQRKVRHDQAGVSVLFDPEAKALRFAFHRERLVATLDHPVPNERYRGAWAESLGPEGRKLLGFALEAPVETTRTTVAGYEANRLSATVGNGLGNRYRVAVTVGSPGEAPAPPEILELEGILNQLRFSGQGWWPKVVAGGGLPLAFEEAELLPEDEVVYREDLLSIGEVEVSAGHYEAPAGYRAIAFPTCARLRG
jgi:hypothetical protein